MAKANSAISLGIASLIVIALIIVVAFGVYLNSTFNRSSTTSSSISLVTPYSIITSTTSISVTTKSNSTDDIVISGINSSLPCGIIGGIIGTGVASPLAPSLNLLISQINASSHFIALEGNETGQYKYDGGGCASYMGPPSYSTQQPSLTFQYVDKNHPFPDPCGGTALPVFYINAIIDAVSNGYDLSHTTYQTIWFNAGNTTFTCPSTSTITG